MPGGHCAANGSVLAAYLKTLDSSQIVVAASLQNEAADVQLGHFAHRWKRPHQGQQSSRRLHRHRRPGRGPRHCLRKLRRRPQGQCLLQHSHVALRHRRGAGRSNGNYNFESSDILEYWVDPRGLDAASNRTGSVTIGVSGTDPSGPYIAQRYLRPDGATGAGGYWLLILNRYDMSRR